jgi:uncharacterized protein (UPF0216 family)
MVVQLMGTSDSPTKWHSWYRKPLRTLTEAQQEAIQNRELDYYFDEPSITRQQSIHRLAMLLWINEIEYACQFFDTPKCDHHFGHSLAEHVFRMVVLMHTQWGGGFVHPEYGYVHYAYLSEGSAVQASTASLSDLLQMDQPQVVSVDGFVDERLDMCELKRIAEIVPEQHHKDLRLPLILLPPSSQYNGNYKLLGGRIEEFLLKNLLKLNVGSFEKFVETRGCKFVEDISSLRRRKFCTIYRVFEVSGERSELESIELAAKSRC